MEATARATIAVTSSSVAPLYNKDPSHFNVANMERLHMTLAQLSHFGCTVEGLTAVRRATQKEPTTAQPQAPQQSDTMAPPHPTSPFTQLKDKTHVQSAATRTPETEQQQQQKEKLAAAASATTSLRGPKPSFGGVSRPGFSDADMAARRWLIAEMQRRGLETKMDGVGNVFGRWNGVAGSKGKERAILIGSHLDTVVNSGQLDGALGIVCALECVSRLQELHREGKFVPRYPIEVIATSEEEGRFGGMLGSQALAGKVNKQWLETARDTRGVLLKDAMARCGLKHQDALQRCKRDPRTLRAFIELHVEQGPVLDANRIPIGVVEGVAGRCTWNVTLKGRADHSGTTPMELRSDAFIGLAEFGASLKNIAATQGSSKTSSRLTVGRVSPIIPNFPHTTVGELSFSLCLRDTTEEGMRSLDAACRKQLKAICRAHSLIYRIEQQSWLSPKMCHREIVSAVEKQANRFGVPCMRLSSGAGHDAQNLADICPCGMIFVPSVGGISHCAEEFTTWRDIKVGMNMLLHVVAGISGSALLAGEKKEGTMNHQRSSSSMQLSSKL